MSTNFLVKKPSTGLSVSVIKKDLNGKVLSDKICTGLGYVECTLNRADEVIELRLIEKVRKPLDTKNPADWTDKAKAINTGKEALSPIEDAPLEDAGKTVPMTSKPVVPPKTEDRPKAMNPAAKEALKTAKDKIPTA